MTYRFSDLAYAYSQPGCSGLLKQQNADFRVDEVMPVALSGEGEHLWLKIEKDGSNTDWVAQQLARQLGIRPMQVSYAGLKDRHAITTQWFSIQLPGQPDPAPEQLLNEEFRVLESVRHDRKLKRGALSGNVFSIKLRQLQGDRDALLSRLEQVKQKGVPNYFGEQRFGHGMGNLERALKLFNREFKKVKKSQRSLYLSAARSWIFNQILSTRIKQGCWDVPLRGEVYMLNGRSACFIDDQPEENRERMQAGDIHLTGALWGEGESMASAEVAGLEQQVAEQWQAFADGLESARMKQERRALRLLPDNMSWQLENDHLRLQFELPAGAFATMVLRECIQTRQEAPDSAA